MTRQSAKLAKGIGLAVAALWLLRRWTVNLGTVNIVASNPNDPTYSDTGFDLWNTPETRQLYSVTFGDGRLDYETLTHEAAQHGAPFAWWAQGWPGPCGPKGQEDKFCPASFGDGAGVHVDVADISDY